MHCSGQADAHGTCDFWASPAAIGVAGHEHAEPAIAIFQSLTFWLQADLPT